MALENHSREFRRVYAAHAPAVARFLRAHCGDADLVEDVLQETFMLVLRHLHRYDAARGGMRSWIFKIAHNCLKSEFRRAGNSREIAEPEQLEQIAYGGLTPEELITAKITSAEIREAIQALPEPERSVLIECKLKGGTLKQVGEKLGMANRTVSRKLFSALEQLKEIVGERELNPAN